MGFASRFASAYVSELNKESNRRKRLLEKQKKLESAMIEVDRYNDYIEALIVIHTQSSVVKDWGNIANSPEPQAPVRLSNNQKSAQNKLEAYKPNFIDRLFKLQQLRVNTLNNNVSKAKKLDDEEYHRKSEEYKIEYAEWMKEKEFAQNIVTNNLFYFKQALIEQSGIQDLLNTLGYSIEYTVHNSNSVSVSLYINSEKVIPDYTKTLTATGKLSTRKLAKGKYNQLLFDHVSSCIIKIAKDVFGLLPINSILISVTDRIIIDESDHTEDKAIISVFIPKQTLRTIELSNIQPSESIKHFKHSIDYKKTKGFNVIQPLTYSQL